MAQPLASESTSFTLDNMGRFLCNTYRKRWIAPPRLSLDANATLT